MKKLFVILTAIAVLGFAGTTMAAITPGNFVQTGYTANAAGDTGTQKYTDLGDASAIVGALPSGSIFTDNLTLADVGAASWAEINVGLFSKESISQSTFPFGIEDFIYFMTDNTTAPAINSVGSFLGNANTVGNTAVSGATSSITTDAGYGKLMNGFGSVAPASGYLDGLLQNPEGEVNLANLDSGLTASGYLWFATNESGAWVYDEAPSAEVIFGLDSGDFYTQFAEFNPVPVPGAVWLLGSGLLALVGIRRRNRR